MNLEEVEQILARRNYVMHHIIGTGGQGICFVVYSKIYKTLG